MTNPRDPAQPVHDPTLAERMALVDEVEGAAPLHRIDISNEPDAIRTLGRALRRRILPDTYNRAGKLTQVTGRPVTLAEIDPSTMRRLLAHHAFVYKVKAIKGKKDEPPTYIDVETSPAPQVCKDVLSETDWRGVPELEAVVTAPVLKPDGTLLQEPGYDPLTRTYYAPRLPIGRVPQTPSADEVRAARQLVLHDVLGDFAWKAEADKANYLALLLTPIMATYHGGLSPLGAVDATVQGTGKTLLAGDIPEALYGIVSKTWEERDDELRKAITGVLMTEAAPVVLFDNVPEESTVKSAILAKLLTSKKWSDRPLQTSTNFSGINDRLWLVTGNSMSFGGDMASRTVLVGLDAKMANPSLRSGFTIPNLQAWLADETNAVRLLYALLVLVMDWVAAGCPKRTIEMRQFAPWASAAAGLLDHHGVPGLLDNRGQLAERDDQNALWLAFADEWYAHFKDEWKLPIEVARSAEQQWGQDPWKGRYLVDNRGNPASQGSLGKKLKARRGAFFGGDDGYRLEAMYDGHSKSTRYRMIRAADVVPDEHAPRH
jgi:hypothetical protein